VTGYILTHGPVHRTIPVGAAAVTLAGAAILAQVAYPLTDGSTQNLLTIASVILFTGASVLHAGATRGAGWAAILVAVAAGVGLTAEVVGIRTGLPFGAYHYAETLGPQVLGVPVIVPMAWTMMAYPCLLLGRRLGHRLSCRLGRASAGHHGARRLPADVVAVATGALALASWDLFLDPQMVAAGHWAWTDPTPSLPGVPGVPLTNYAGWLLVAALIIGLLHILLPAPGWRTGYPEPEGVPAALLTWTWIGSAVGNVAFFGRPAVAAWGAVAMGALVVPYLLTWGELLPGRDLSARHDSVRRR
jgi:uncharacterized membrane protein